MKAVAFDYACPQTLAEAIEHLERTDVYAKVLAGGQSLGPMLNLRLVQPGLLVDVTRIPELGRIEEHPEHVLLGACTTHAIIEDGAFPDATHGILPGIATGIAYRAIRNRGTLGGSLAHADPAADWVTCMAALGADVLLAGPGGRRRVPVADLLLGAFETRLCAGEILDAVCVPRLSQDTHWGFYKFCRKTGEFPAAMAAVLRDAQRSQTRLVVGATGSRPLVVEDASDLLDAVDSSPARVDDGAIHRLLAEHGIDRDPFTTRIHHAVITRALHRAYGT